MKWPPLFSGSTPEITSEWLADHPTFCMMPFVHQHVTQHGTVTPCCVAPWQEEESFGHVDKQSLMEIWEGEKMNTFRAGMIQGKRDARCDRCYEKEASGTKSLRKITNGKFAHHLDRVQQANRKGNMKEAPPVYYDLRFSNVCNYRCRICGPWSSSKWHKDGLALGMTNSASAMTHATSNTQELLDQFEANIDAVEELYFAGGEPLMMDEHYHLLELLIKHGKREVRLSYNTNFSSFAHKHWNVLELWQQFDHVNLAASLDAMGERAEILRKEQDWSQVISNLENLRKQVPNVQFVITPTVYNLNVLHLPDFHQFMVSEGYIAVENFMPHVLIQPEYYNIRCMPNDAKQAVAKRLKEHLIWMGGQPAGDQEKYAYVIGQYEGMLEHINFADHSHLLPELRKRTRALDVLRNERSAEVFPELDFLREADPS